jgi:hypothetical protein
MNRVAGLIQECLYAAMARRNGFRKQAHGHWLSGLGRLSRPPRLWFKKSQVRTHPVFVVSGGHSERFESLKRNLPMLVHPSRRVARGDEKLQRTVIER